MKGIPSSKLYEYLALGKPIVLCPSDGDLMEKMITESGLGFVANSAEHCYEQILKIKSHFERGEVGELKINSQTKIQKFSRFNQLLQIKEVLGD